jgi:CubicO group peptidase (beta-lactamase class C family)
MKTMALDEIDSWPVDHAAGAVLDVGSGTVGLHGDVDRIYGLASVTKPLVGYGVLIAVEEEAIALDQPAGPPGATVAHLLAHASGVAFDSAEQLAPPGTQRIYSSYGYEVLADLIAAETGIEFPEYLRQAVFEPLGMRSSVLSGSAGHGASSTVTDLLAFLREVASPTLLDRSTVDASTSVQFPGLPGFVPGYGKFADNTWGYGFEVRGGKHPHWTGSRNSPGTVGHFGQAGTFLWLDRDNRKAAVVLTDRAFGAWAKPLWSEFNDRLLDRE